MAEFEEWWRSGDKKYPKGDFLPRWKERRNEIRQRRAVISGIDKHKARHKELTKKIRIWDKKIAEVVSSRDAAAKSGAKLVGAGGLKVDKTAQFNKRMKQYETLQRMKKVSKPSLLKRILGKFGGSSAVIPEGLIRRMRREAQRKGHLKKDKPSS